MIGGVEGISSVFPIDYARNVARAREVFSIPDSALRIDGAQAAEGVSAERDPIVDSVELSRNMSNFMVNSTYAPPVEQLLNLAPAAGKEADAAADREGNPAAAAEAPGESEEGEDGGEVEDAGEAADPNAEKGADGQPLDENEQAQLRELKSRDQEVRAHEQAHMSVGGSYAGAASYEYQQGPDGARYAVGGEVSIDMSPEQEPEATIAKMLIVKAAAMAPAEPSPQDYSVAAQAGQTEAEARTELSAQQAEAVAGAGKTGEAGENGETGGTDSATGADAAASDVSGGAPERSSSGMPGMNEGTASLSSSNPFVRRYAENAYSAANAMASYMPINIVA